jgi:hypothetical protein
MAVAVVDGVAVQSAEVVAEPAELSAIAARPQLLPNVPNPFNPQTELRFALSAPGGVQLTIVDAAGRRVRTVTLPSLAAGNHAWIWNSEDDGGRPVSSGVYRVRLDAAGASDVRSVTLVRRAPVAGRPP